MRNGSVAHAVRPGFGREVERDLEVAVAQVREASDPVEVTVSRSVKVALDGEGRVVVCVTSKSTLTTKQSWVVEGGAPALTLG